MEIIEQKIEDIFTLQRTQQLGFTNRVRLEFLQSMRWDKFQPIRTIGELAGTSPFLLRRRPRVGDVTVRYIKAVLGSIGIKYP